MTLENILTHFLAFLAGAVTVMVVVFFVQRSDLKEYKRNSKV